MVIQTLTPRPISNRLVNKLSGKPRRWPCTEWHAGILRDRYDSQTGTITELQRLFVVPRWVVRHWAQQLGISRLKEPPWSEEELAYLESNYHHAAVVTIAARLKRSLCGTKLKAKRIGLRKTSEGYTLP